MGRMDSNPARVPRYVADPSEPSTKEPARWALPGLSNALGAAPAETEPQVEVVAHPVAPAPRPPARFSTAASPAPAPPAPAGPQAPRAPALAPAPAPRIVVPPAATAPVAPPVAPAARPAAAPERRLASFMPLESGELLAAVANISRGGLRGDLFLYQNGVVVTEEGLRLPWRLWKRDTKAAPRRRVAERIAFARARSGHELAAEHPAATYLPFAQMSGAQLGGIVRWRLRLVTTNGHDIRITSARNTNPNFASSLRLLRIGICNRLDRAGATATGTRVMLLRLAVLLVGLGGGGTWALAHGASLGHDSELVTAAEPRLGSMTVCLPSQDSTADRPCLDQQPAARVLSAGPDPIDPGTTSAVVETLDGSHLTVTLPGPAAAAQVMRARTVQIDSVAGAPVFLDADGARIPAGEQLSGVADLDALTGEVDSLLGAGLLVAMVIGLLGLRVNRRAGLVPPRRATA
jgi:hypothetical protein